MSRRIPLWATLVPLVAGVLAWGWLWRGHAAGLRADIEAAVPAGQSIEMSGFPYRLEAHLAPFRDSYAGAAARADIVARELVVNRVPWQRDRQVVSLADSTVRVALAPLAGATASVKAAEAQASLRLEEGRIGRLSIVWEKPEIGSGLLPANAAADHLELHLREPPVGEAKGAGTSGGDAAQAELVLAASGFRLGAGSPVALELQADITGQAPLRDFSAWAAGGAVAIRSLALRDATGEIARFTGRLTPDGSGRLRVEGAIDTVCPATVRAAVSGAAAPSEMRARKPERIAISGHVPAGLLAAAADPTRPTPPVRGQEPPCPRLR